MRRDLLIAFLVLPLAACGPGGPPPPTAVECDMVRTRTMGSVVLDDICADDSQCAGAVGTVVCVGAGRMATIGVCAPVCGASGCPAGMTCIGTICVRQCNGRLAGGECPTNQRCNLDVEICNAACPP